MRIPTMSALVMSLCACHAADAQPNVSIERIHQAGFVDAIGLEVIDAQHLLVADTTVRAVPRMSGKSRCRQVRIRASPDNSCQHS